MFSNLLAVLSVQKKLAEMEDRPPVVPPAVHQAIAACRQATTEMKALNAQMRAELEPKPKEEVSA